MQADDETAAMEPSPTGPLRTTRGRSFTAVLVALGFLTFGVFFWNQHNLDVIAADAHLINQAGRQRMLCERITHSALGIASSPDRARIAAYATELERDLAAWSATQRELREGETQQAGGVWRTRAVEDLLASIEPDHQASFRSARSLLAAAAAGAPRRELERHLETLRRSQVGYLRGMEEVVARYEAGAHHFVAQIRGIGVVVLALSLGIIAAAFVPFRTAQREIQQRRRAEARLEQRAREAQLLTRVTAMAATAASVDEALGRCLQIVCEWTGWPVGHVYHPDPDGSARLVPSSLWRLPEGDVFAALRRVTESTCFEPGEGLPGRILVSRQPEWIRDVHQDANFPRAQQASEINVRGAFGFPVYVWDHLVAVLEFFTPRAMDPDVGLLALVGHIGIEIGRVVERQKAERAVQDNEGRLRATFETVLDSIVTIDESGVIQSLNPATEKLFGYASAEMLGQNVSMLMPEPDRSNHPGYLRRYLESGDPRILGIGREVEAMRKDGSLFPADLAVSAMQVAGRSHFVGVVRDITERKRVQQMKDEFISTVSHELRTPLTSIRGSLGLILGGAMGEVPDEAKELIEVAGRNTDRLSRLINDILDLEKIESGKMRFELRSLPLRSALVEAVEANRSFAEQFGVGCVLVEPVPEAEVLADGDRLMQVLTNLLSNAVKFSPASGEVSIEAERCDDRVRISVTDRGDGIPEEFHDKLFEKFTQASSDSTRRVGGTGLGLSICKAIMEEMGGAIGFESEPGRGTTLWIELPVPVTCVADAEAGSAARRVLVCEDDPDIGRLLCLLLERQGFAAEAVSTAADAKRRLAKRRYHAMTVDLGLPDQDGMDLLRELRSEPSTASLPIVVVTAAAGEDRLRLNGDAKEIVDWIQKPIDEARLLEALRVALSRTRSSVPRVLHLEDDPDIRQVVRQLVGERAEVVSAGTLAAAQETLRREPFDLVIIDVGLPDGSGLEVLREIDPSLPVILFTAQDVHEDLGRVVEAMLVKSEVMPEALLETIVALLDRAPADA